MATPPTPDKIRNVAIVAHIDHGKTTLLDSLLKQSHLFRENEEVPIRAMDYHDLEKERGITIFAKHTCLYYAGYKINLIDTPGHADFSGEVERVLGMVGSVLLLVDAQEGPMPQTRFVLSRALRIGLQPIVVLNKIDRPHANPDAALNKTFDLFVELGASDAQLDFPYCYASGLSGFAMRHLADPKENMNPLFEMIVQEVPAPTGDGQAPFLMQAMSLVYDDFIGRGATGRVLSGGVAKGDVVICVDKEGKQSTHKVMKIEGSLGLKKIEHPEAVVGDIVTLYGIPEVMIGDTLCSPEKIEPLPRLLIGEPTLSIDILVNQGPLAGKEGKHVTMNKIRDRLLHEKRANPSYRIEEVAGQEDRMRVMGRGELHLSILIETMRRENFELVLAKPQVILREIDGVSHEPFEKAHIEVPEAFSGTIIDELSRRKGELHALHTNEHNITTLMFLIPTRGLMGYRNEFLTVTRGQGILTSVFDAYYPWKGAIPGRKHGALISNSRGRSTAYALFHLQDRGAFFLGAGVEVYEGMIVGENSRGNDLVVNVTKEKHLTNIRASGKDEALVLTPPRILTLEEAMDFIEEDELVEVTPLSIRMRTKRG